MKQLFHLL